MNKKVILLLLSLITSCSTDIINTKPEYINDKKSFNIKAEYSVQNTYLDYKGNWTRVVKKVVSKSKTSN